MDKLKIKQKNDLINSLSNLYFCDLDFLKDYNFYKTNSEKVYISKINIDNLNITRFSSIGVYFGTFHDNFRFRLSIEGSKLINPSKNYIILKKTVLSSYLAAENLFKEDLEFINWENKCPFLIVKCDNKNLGSVSIKDNVILNYIPKSRKLDYNKLF